MGFKDYIVQISLRDKNNKEKYIGSEANWELAENPSFNSNKKPIPIIEYGEAAFRTIRL